MRETGEIAVEETVSASRRSLLLTVAAAVCAVAFIAVYYFFVWTHAGQAFEFDVLKAAPALLDTPPVLRARFWLFFVNEYSVAVVVLLVLVVGFLRRRPALAIVGVAVMVLTAGIDRVLVRWVFTRPPLVVDPFSRENSFPSGHVAMGLSAVLGLVIVVPYAWRGATALLGAALTVGIAEMTMTVGWHRLSDTIGGNLLALGLACLAFALLLRRAGARTPTLSWPPLSGHLAVFPLLGYAAYTAATLRGTQFAFATALATVLSALAVVAFLLLADHADPAPIELRRGSR